MRKPKIRIKDPALKRVNKQSFMFNSRELNAINYYCRKYKVGNRSKFYRETIITAILKKFDSDYPTLFEDDNPTLFSRI